jgi:hypothetical protein
MTKVRCVIDPVLVSHSVHSRKLPAAILDAGHELVEATYVEDSKSWNFPEIKQYDLPTLFYGSKKFVRQHSQLYAPGSFGDTPRSSVSFYMTHLPREWFLNRYALMTTWGDFCVRREYWLNFAGGRAFLRPDTGSKLFTGLVVDRDNVDHEINSIQQLSHMAAEDFVWTARAKEIHGEFRFVIADGQVIAGSEYRWDGRLDIRSDYPEECRELAQRVASHPWQLDRVYTCDVCLSEDGVRLVELNGFSSAGLYACDLDAVVAGVSAAAVAEHRDLFGK